MGVLRREQPRRRPAADAESDHHHAFPAKFHRPFDRCWSRIIERLCRQKAALEPFSIRSPPVWYHRSFRVLNATSAQTIEIIQKRVTTTVSGHPPSSKW